jgi:hypothetical protein
MTVRAALARWSAGGALALLLALAGCGGSDVPPILGSGFMATPEAGPEVAPPLMLPQAAPSDDPTTCDQAAMLRSYVGCDFWPTVVANDVWSIFDYAVVVANAGSTAATVTITGPMSVHQTQTVQSDTLAKFYLPWVSDLKGPDTDSCGVSVPLQSSVVHTVRAGRLARTGRNARA